MKGDARPTRGISRRVYGGILALAIVGIGTLFFYRTFPSPAPPAQIRVSAIGEFGGVSLNIEYAMTDMERQKGLGGRATIPPDYGMLFVFPKDGYYGFWMKDTRVPLDMFWLDAQGQTVSIVQNVATSSFPTVFYPSVPARYVLETTAGFAGAHAIATGTPLVLKDLPTVSK